jgi:hypothetical protein
MLSMSVYKHKHTKFHTNDKFYIKHIISSFKIKVK